jgi:hypothetical protein
VERQDARGDCRQIRPRSAGIGGAGGVKAHQWLGWSLLGGGRDVCRGSVRRGPAFCFH